MTSAMTDKRPDANPPVDAVEQQSIEGFLATEEAEGWQDFGDAAAEKGGIAESVPKGTLRIAREPTLGFCDAWEFVDHDATRCEAASPSAPDESGRIENIRVENGRVVSHKRSSPIAFSWASATSSSRTASRSRSVRSL